MSEQLN